MSTAPAGAPRRAEILRQWDRINRARDRPLIKSIDRDRAKPHKLKPDKPENFDRRARINGLARSLAEGDITLDQFNRALRDAYRED